MAIRNVVTRGYGAGATIAFVVTRGYSIGEEAVALVPDTHVLRFTSVSRSVLFSAVQRRTTFSSASRSIQMTDTPQPLGFILTEDGGTLLQENDVPIALE